MQRSVPQLDRVDSDIGRPHIAVTARSPFVCARTTPFSFWKLYFSGALSTLNAVDPAGTHMMGTQDSSERLMLALREHEQ